MNPKKLTAQTILADCMMMERHLTETYNEAANESVGDDFRSDMMSILEEEHQLQSACVHSMNRRGYLKVHEADKEEIRATLSRVDKKGL